MYRYLPLLLALVLISGCGTLIDLFGLDGTFFTRESGSSDLKAFTSQQELVDYFTRRVNARHQGSFGFGGLRGPGFGVLEADEALGGMADDPMASPPSGEGAGGDVEVGDTTGSDDDFSQTTIQEEGVDEADVVKTDGSHVYIIHNDTDGGLLRIVDVSPPEAIAQIGEFALEGFGREMYLYDGKVVALTETYGGYHRFGGGGIAVEPAPVSDTAVDSDTTVTDNGAETEPVVVEPEVIGEVLFERPSTIVTIIDVTEPATPTLLSRTSFEGRQSSSRMIDGVLHLVLANYQDVYYDVLPALNQAAVDLSEVDVEAMLPGYEHVDGQGGTTTRNMLTWRELYYPTDPDGFGVVAVISLDVDNEAAFSAVGVVAEPGLIYSSLDALYLTDTEYDFREEVRETTDIYKFAYVGRAVEPGATGSVPGRVLNQYSMGEYEGYLRVATTVEGGFTFFGERQEPSNNVYVLGEAAGLAGVGGALEVVGSIEGIAEGETIQSARFVGDRGYLVTFEQIDPLFTLNLSDPADPRVVGELKVPGFSTFLVPMGADHLLAVGQYIPEEGPFFGWGVQLTIFDVSDFTEPEEMDKVVLGVDRHASSEALYNPKAFTYFAERGLVALPVRINSNGWFFGEGAIGVDVADVDDDGAVPEPTDPTEPAPDEPIDVIGPMVPQGFEGLVVYSVSPEEGFAELGGISTRFDEMGGRWASFTRGVFIGDDVFAVTDAGVRGAPILDLESMVYEVTFE